MKFRFGVIAEAAIVCAEVAKRETVQVVLVGGIAERTVVGVVRGLDSDAAAGYDEAVKFFHGADYVGHVLDDVNGAQAPEGAVGEGIREAVEIAEDVGGAGRVEIDSDGTGKLPNATTNVKRSHA